MIGQIDYNGDGDVDFDEFLVLMVKQIKIANDQEEELVEVFKSFDFGNDGLIDVSDLF
jgi:Ca2+-binding EF-hand superfamily protein